MSTATEVKINVDLLVDALAHIQVFPERYHQGSWASEAKVDDAEEAWNQPEPPPICKTAFCVAGWVCNIGDPKGKPDVRQSSSMLLHDWYPTGMWIDGEGNGRDYENFAMELLGIPEDLIYKFDDDSHRVVVLTASMFGGDNDLDQVYDYASDLTGLSLGELHNRVDARATEVRTAYMARKAEKGDKQ